MRSENRQKESNLIEMEERVKFKDVKRAQSLTDCLETRLQGRNQTGEEMGMQDAAAVA